MGLPRSAVVQARLTACPQSSTALPSVRHHITFLFHMPPLTGRLSHKASLPYQNSAAVRWVEATDGGMSAGSGGCVTRQAVALSYGATQGIGVALTEGSRMLDGIQPLG